MTLEALGALIGISLVVQTATDPLRLGPNSTRGLVLSIQAQQARMQPLIRSANECIARAVSADPRFGADVGSANVNDLIVDSVPACVEAIRAIIDQHDVIYGTGTGEIFFMGYFLDALPASVHRLTKDGQR